MSYAGSPLMLEDNSSGHSMLQASPALSSTVSALFSSIANSFIWCTVFLMCVLTVCHFSYIGSKLHDTRVWSVAPGLIVHTGKARITGIPGTGI